MTNDEKYTEFYKFNRNLEFEEFFLRLMDEFNVGYRTATDIWYAVQRSWYRPEMIDELIRLDSTDGEFKPCLVSGEWSWDAVAKKFCAMISAH